MDSTGETCNWMHGLKRFVSYLLFFLTLHLASQASVADTSYSKFHISLWLNNGKIFQNNVNTVLDILRMKLDMLVIGFIEFHVVQSLAQS